MAEVYGQTLAIGSRVGGATALSVLFIDSSKRIAQDNTGINFDPATNLLTIGGSGKIQLDGSSAGAVKFGSNVDLQCNTSNTGPTFAVNASPGVLSLFRREAAAGAVNLFLVQGEGVNDAASSFIAAQIKFLQVSNVAGSETGQVRIATTLNNVTTECWIFDQNGHFVTKTAGTFDIGASGSSLPRSIYFGTSLIGLSDSATIKLGASSDVILNREAANGLSLKNGANAQTFTIYGTTTGPRTLILNHSGSAGVIKTNTTDPLQLGTNNAITWLVNGTTGHFTPNGSGSYDLGDSSNYVRDLFVNRRILNNGYIEFVEMADPSAGSTNTGRLYCKDNGSGKTQLVVRFPTGAVQVIATEP